MAPDLACYFSFRKVSLAVKFSFWVKYTFFQYRINCRLFLFKGLENSRLTPLRGNSKVYRLQDVHPYNLTLKTGMRLYKEDKHPQCILSLDHIVSTPPFRH